MTSLVMFLPVETLPLLSVLWECVVQLCVGWIKGGGVFPSHQISQIRDKIFITSNCPTLFFSNLDCNTISLLKYYIQWDGFLVSNPTVPGICLVLFFCTTKAFFCNTLDLHISHDHVSLTLVWGRAFIRNIIYKLEPYLWLKCCNYLWYCSAFGS